MFGVYAFDFQRFKPAYFLSVLLAPSTMTRGLLPFVSRFLKD